MPRKRKPSLVWSATAARNLEAIRAYIALDSPVAADRFLARIERAAKNLQSFPYTGEVLKEDERGQLREFYFKSYRVIFRRRDEAIRILAVLHSSRDIRPQDIDGGEIDEPK
jgi:toxin ParE1/3/4